MLLFSNKNEITSRKETNIRVDTDYGPPMKPLFIKYQTFGLGQQNWADKFWRIFSQTISTHFGTVSPLSMFSIIQPLFLQKIFIWDWNWDLNLGRKELEI